MAVMDQLAYRQQLIALLPPSGLWADGDGSDLVQLLDAMAAELARIDARASVLMDESDPCTAYELLADWERVCGLPSPCMAGQAQTLTGRRDAVQTRLAGRGGQSRAYFIELASVLGYTITITEFERHTVGSGVDQGLCGEAWRFAWQVNAPAATVRTADVRSGVDEALRSWGNALLECAINNDKPAQSVVLYAYG